MREMGGNIRVASISPGLVETEFAEMAKNSKEAAQKTYSSIECLQAEDMAANIRHILELPKHVQITDILVRPTTQKS